MEISSSLRTEQAAEHTLIEGVVAVEAQTEQSVEAEPAQTTEESQTSAVKAILILSLGIVAAANCALAARGGNYKVTRQNLAQQGKLNSKEKMSPEQKKIRRQKRKKK